MFAIISNLGWDIDDLRDIVEAVTDQRHISALTGADGNKVILELERLVKEDRMFKFHPSERQINKIYKLGYLLKWNTTTIRKFNKRTNNKWDIWENTTKEASKLIMAMEAV